MQSIVIENFINGKKRVDRARELVRNYLNENDTILLYACGETKEVA